MYATGSISPIISAIDPGQITLNSDTDITSIDFFSRAKTTVLHNAFKGA
jgi:hypothetical protein